MASRAQRYRAKLSLANTTKLADSKDLAEARKLQEVQSKLEFCASILARKASTVTPGDDLKKASKLAEQAAQFVEDTISDITDGEGLSLAEIEAADTKAMGKKAVGLMKEAMAIAKQLAKVLPKSKWPEAEAFLKRAMST